MVGVGAESGQEQAPGRGQALGQLQSAEVRAASGACSGLKVAPGTWPAGMLRQENFGPAGVNLRHYIEGLVCFRTSEPWRRGGPRHVRVMPTHAYIVTCTPYVVCATVRYWRAL